MGVVGCGVGVVGYGLGVVRCGLGVFSCRVGVFTLIRITLGFERSWFSDVEQLQGC